MSTEHVSTLRDLQQRLRVRSMSENIAARTPAGWDAWAQVEDGVVPAYVWATQRAGRGPYSALSPDDARAFAARLVELADYAESAVA